MAFEPSHFCEASLCRLVSSVSRGPFTIVTAVRREFDFAQNASRNEQLLSRLNGQGMGPHMLVGHWDTPPERMDYETAKREGNLVQVREHSFFVPMPQAMGLDEFRTAMVVAMGSYNQDAIIFGNDLDDVCLIFRGGGSQEYGKGLTVNKAGEMYSLMKKGMGQVPFVFEGAAQPVNVISRLAFKMSGLRWLSEVTEPTGPRCLACEGRDKQVSSGESGADGGVTGVR